MATRAPSRRRVGAPPTALAAAAAKPRSSDFQAGPRAPIGGRAQVLGGGDLSEQPTVGSGQLLQGPLGEQAEARDGGAGACRAGACAGRGTASGGRKVLGILVHRRGTGHRGGRWRAEQSHYDRHQRQVISAKSRSGPASPDPVQRVVVPGHAVRRIGHPGAPGRPPELHPAIAIGVAIAYVGLAVGNGGYSSELQAGATVAVWWAVAVALALGGWPRSRVPAAALGAGLCLAAFAAWTAGSIVLGQRSRWRLHRDRSRARLPRGVRPGGHRIAPSQRPSLARGRCHRARGRSPAWPSSAASSRRSPGATNSSGSSSPRPRGGSAIRSATGTASRRRWRSPRVLLVWLGGHARSAGVRAVAVGAIPLPILVVYLASSRGGVAAGVAGLAVLLALGPERARMFGGLVMGGVGGALLISLASSRHELVDAIRKLHRRRPGGSDAGLFDRGRDRRGPPAVLAR